MSRFGVRLALPLVLLSVAALIVSLMKARPSRLPGVALGSAVLLHIERAAASFALVVAITSVLREAARGRLPTQLTTGGLAYETAATAATEEALQDLQGQVERVVAALAADRVDAPDERS